MIKRLMLVCLSVLLSLLIAEIFIRNFLPQKTYSFVYQNGMSCFQKSAILPFTLKPNCTFSFQDFDTKEKFTTKINSLGYRDEDFDLEKKKQEKRILIEGDSFILGFGVKEEDTISSSLQKKLKSVNPLNPFYNTRVINAGYAGGFGPDGYFLHLKSKGMMLKPNLVIFSIFVYNDFSDMENDEWFGIGQFGEPKRVTSKTVTVDYAGHLVPISMPIVYRFLLIRESHAAILISEGIGKMNSLLKREFDRIRFKINIPDIPSGEAKDTDLLGPYTNACIFGNYCHRKVMHLFSDLETTIKASKNLLDLYYKDGKTHFVVLLIPADFQIYKDEVAKYNDVGIPLDAAAIKDPNPQKRIREMLEKENITYIDLLPAFRNSSERLYFEKDEHWNKNGHKLAADEIIKWIEKNKVQ